MMIMRNEKLNNCVADLEGEVWEVINHPSIGRFDNYAISNYGRVKILNYRKIGRERIMKQSKSKNGYFKVVLCRKNEKRKTFSVHRLVALMFIPNPENLPCVNHKSEVKSENQASNLEWCSVSYNLMYNDGAKKRAQTRKNSTVWMETMAKVNAKRSKKVYQYTKNGLELVSVYVSTREAERQTGFYSGHICACCNGKRNRKTAYGFIWSYEPLPNTSNQLTLFPTITKVS